MEFLDGEGTAAGRTAIEAPHRRLRGVPGHRVRATPAFTRASAWTVGPPPASLRPPRRPQRRLLRVPVPLWFPSAHTAASLAAGAAVGIFLLLGVAEYLPKRNPLQEFQSAT